jgi:hypothetical protein
VFIVDGLDRSLIERSLAAFLQAGPQASPAVFTPGLQPTL